METRQRGDDRALDRAVELTFPASDPIAPKHVTSTEPPGAPPPANAVSDRPVGSPVDPAALPSGEAPVPAQPRREAPAAVMGRNAMEVCPRCRGYGVVGVYQCPACRP